MAAVVEHTTLEIHSAISNIDVLLCYTVNCAIVTLNSYLLLYYILKNLFMLYCKPNYVNVDQTVCTLCF